MEDKISIDIDLVIYKFIVQHSNYINEPASDVLKRVLRLNNGSVPEDPQSTKAPTGGLTVKGVYLRNGMQLRKHFKGKLFVAIVRDGYIEFNKKEYTTPSGAAVEAAKGAVNGWRFWEYQDETSGRWELLETLRQQ